MSFNKTVTLGNRKCRLAFRPFMAYHMAKILSSLLEMEFPMTFVCPTMTDKGLNLWLLALVKH